MQPDDHGSVTRWIDELKAKGDDEAARRLWERYYSRLVNLARARLKIVRRAGAMEDEEDAALNAFHSLWRGATAGHFDELSDRDDLWRLLVVLTIRKVSDQISHQFKAKRGGGRIIGESASAGDGEGEGPLGRVIDDGPTPEHAAVAAELHRRLRESLADDVARQVFDLRLEGYSRREIADRLGCAEKTVTRKLNLIRDAFSEELD